MANPTLSLISMFDDPLLIIERESQNCTQLLNVALTFCFDTHNLYLYHRSIFFYRSRRRQTSQNIKPLEIKQNLILFYRSRRQTLPLLALRPASRQTLELLGTNPRLPETPYALHRHLDRTHCAQSGHSGSHDRKGFEPPGNG